jgi:hypothetical protein
MRFGNGRTRDNPPGQQCARGLGDIEMDMTGSFAGIGRIRGNGDLQGKEPLKQIPGLSSQRK